MAGRPATISDLFSPMNSIKTCMDSHGSAIEESVMQVNESVLHCAGKLSATNKLFKSAAKSMEKTVIDSMKDLNSAMQKQVVAGASSAAGIASSISSSINDSVSSVMDGLIGIGRQLSEIGKLTRLIEGHVDPVKSMAYQMKNKMKTVLNPFAADTSEKKVKPSKLKAPDVSGGKGAGDLAKSLAEAAKIIDGISYPRAIMTKIKAKKIIGGLLDVFSDNEKRMSPAQMKSYMAKARQLSLISDDIAETAANMSVVTPVAPFAVIGAKLSKKLIKEMLLAVKPLSATKNLAKVELGATSLRKISESVLKFAASMSLMAVLAIPAMVGAAGAYVLIKESLWLFKRIGKATVTQSVVKAAFNLRLIGESVLMFSASMALMSILAVPAMAGTAAAFLIMKASTALFKRIGSQKDSAGIRNAALNIELMCLSTIAFTLTLLATTMIMKHIIFGGGEGFDAQNPIALGSSVIVFGAMVGAAMVYKKVLGKKTTTDAVMRGSFAVMLMSASFITFSLSLLVSCMMTKAIVGNSMSNGKFDVEDIAAVAPIAPVFLLMLGSYMLYKQIGKDDNTRKVMNGGLAVVMMAVGFAAFSAAFWVSHQLMKDIVGNWDAKKDPWALVMDVAVLGLMLVSFKFYQKIGKDDNTRKVMNGGLATIMMATGLVAFSAALWLSDKMVGDMWKTGNGKFDFISMMTNVAVIGMMYLSLLVFNQVGNNFTNVAKGTGGVVLMAAGVAAFGFGMGFFVDSVKGASAGDLIAMPLLLGAFALEFAIMGGFAVEIALGSAAALAMAVGIGAFGYGVGFYVESMKGTDWGDVGRMAALIGIFAVEFGLIGIPVVAAVVAMGSAAVLTMSGAIIAFGYAMEEFIKPISKVDFETVKNAGETIGAMGLEFAKVGSPIVAPFVLAGAGVMVVAAGAVAALAGGMKTWAETEMDADKLDLLCVSIDRIKLAFQGNPEGKKGEGGFFKKLGNAVSGALAAPFDMASVTLSASALVVAGGAIKSLSWGIKEWAGAGLDDIDRLDLLCASIDRIKLAFQGNPTGTKEENKGFFAKLKTNMSGALDAPFDLGKMTMTASALAIAGTAMKSLSKGLKEWDNAGVDLDSVNGLITVIIKIRDVFGQMGEKRGGEKSSLLKKTIGVDLSSFEMTDVERGVRSVRRMGNALVSISKGLVEFKEGIGSKFKDSKFMEDFSVSVANVVAGLSDAFARVASDKNAVQDKTREASTWFGRLFQDLTINTFGPGSKNRVEMGIKSVKDLGKTIKDIAEGMKEFKDIVPNGKSSFITDVAAGISALLTGIQEPLVAFGTTDESFSAAAAQMSAKAAQYGMAMSSVHDISAQTMNFEHHKVDVANGMKNIGQIGDLVKGLAEGVKILADAKLTKDLGKAGIVDAEFNVSDGASGMIGNIQKLVCSQVGIFINLGKKIQEVGVFDDLQDEVVQDIRRGGKKVTNRVVRVSKGKKSYLGVAVEAAAGIGGVISGLAEGFKAMNEAFPTDEEMVLGVARVSKAVVAIMAGFSTIGYALKNGGGPYAPEVPPEFKGVFPNVPGTITNLLYAGTNTYETATKCITTVVDGFNKSIQPLVDKKSAVNEFAANANNYMESVIDLMGMTSVLSTHEDGYTVKSFQKSKGLIYTLTAFNGEIAKSSADNSGKISDTLDALNKSMPVLSGIKKSSADSFVGFATQLTKGINTLAGANTNIDKSTKFVTTLHNAVKANVFDNISKNTASIANSINSIDNDIFEPYAKMIDALGKMTDKHSEFVRMQKELYELLKKIIEEINKAGKSDATPASTGSAATGSAPSNPAPKNPAPQQRQTVIARLDRSSVTLEAGTFLDDLARLIAQYKNN